MDNIFVFEDNYTGEKGSSQRFLKRILKQKFGIDQAEILTSEQGKPFLKDGPFFNISHSHNKIVLAISFEGPVGVDIEYIKPRPKFKKVMNTFFTKEEQEQVGDSLEKFYDLWTQKEAFVKLSGGSILSKEFKDHATFDAKYQEIELEGFKGYVCRHLKV